MKGVSFCLMPLALILAVAAFCYKKAAAQGCRIGKMISDKGDTIHFVYDSLSRLKKVTESGEYVTWFDYKHNLIIATETRRDTLIYKRLITLGDNGMMITLFEESYAGMHVGWPPYWRYTAYSYRGRFLIRTETITSKTARTVGTQLQWKSGNFVSEAGSTGDTVCFSYYLNKAVRPGDYWSINVLPTIGLADKLYSNKNLLKTIQYGKIITEIHYRFDSAGRISTMTKTTGKEHVLWRYLYE